MVVGTFTITFGQTFRATPFHQFLLKLKLAMIVGIDCYHDTTAGRRSIAGFVASNNEGMTR